MQGVTPFSRWERELPKLIGDGRWAAVGTLRERRAIFDDFCRTSAEEHKRGKAERAKAGREGFLALLVQAAAPGGHPLSCQSCQSRLPMLGLVPDRACLHLLHPVQGSRASMLQLNNLVLCA